MLPPPLINILESLLDTDQRAIRDFKNGTITGEALLHIQKENAVYIQNLIKENGFPFINISSLKAYKSAFLTVQHSADTNLLQNTISLFQDKTDKEIVRGDLAFLIDRYHILTKQPQLYGTQFKKSEDGSIVFFEIEDQDNLNKRREEMGMTSFEEYKQSIL